MSRQLWMNESVDGSDFDWRGFGPHKKLEGRTADPEALAWDEAARLFSSGLRLARRGELEAGRDQIASAYLLDTRAVKNCTLLPHPDAAELYLDEILFQQLIAIDPSSPGATVLGINFAKRHGTNEQFGQSLIGETMEDIEELIKHIELHPDLENSAEEGGALGGYLSRTILLCHQASLHCSMGNHKRAIKDLNAALKIDPNLTKAREARASLYANLNLKDRKTIHAEFERVVGEVHADNKFNESSYAWLAVCVIDDPELGTLEDAKRYYEKSLRAMSRREELYGPHEPGTTPVALEIIKRKITVLRRTPNAQEYRRYIDNAVQGGQWNMDQETSAPNKLMRYDCLRCGKSAFEKGIEHLMKCGWCKQVHYCSKECQEKDWKSHKHFCKQATAKQV